MGFMRLTVLTLVGCGFVAVPLVRAQTPTFEVASVKPNTTGTRSSNLEQGVVDPAVGDYRSPRSPCPRFVFFVALRVRSFAVARPTSSDSLNCPFAPRRT